MENVKPLTHARIPIVKFYDPETRMECDLSFYNKVSVRNTELFRAYTRADPRVAPLIFAVKRWARARRLTEPWYNGGTVNSYTHVLMLLSFLIQEKVVPPLQQICCSKHPHAAKRRHRSATGIPSPSTKGDLHATPGKIHQNKKLHQAWLDTPTSTRVDGKNALDEHDINNSSASSSKRNGHTASCVACGKRLPEIMTEEYNTYFYQRHLAASSNTKTVGELLVEFFRYYAFDFAYLKDYVAPRVGGVLSRASNGWEDSPDSKMRGPDGQPSALCVQDPFILERNCAITAKRWVVAGMRWEHERALRALISGRGLAGATDPWTPWNALVYHDLHVYKSLERTSLS
ncbi:hypothetical protein THASP1DRAFT_33767 [Thamnocephalis sphaerospora]|uniref:polynucleotide adenylyltransferase n=1 Tax=Thamnocephalis sphaerospora TaxID=78915 RepID=A0A4P9XFS5_9FUNG|nr:hypothetical protein THASP1DRAFT_33767 [Thamnocephalis sphaerospora]|eukprot:RKP04465.1 hypothetical protein THASP1DRAFT_33767 [Thamnocephalis sphaerospora]